jgi:pimeloyl-ACP methyl ester carboxylesterase
VWDEVSAHRLVSGLRDVEALIVHDSDDPQVDFADAKALAAAWPGAELMEVSGLGHMRVLNDPVVLERAVKFLERSRVGGLERV